MRLPLSYSSPDRLFSPPRLRTVLAAAIALATAPAVARAQGFGLNEIGTCAVGRGFAVTAATCNDASVIFWNPAAAATLPGRTLTLGGAVVDVKGGFTQDTTGTRYPSNVQPALVPHGFFSFMMDRYAFGIGVYVPYGLTSQWDGDFPGRFSALKASLATVYVQPNIAVRINPNWQIGAGAVFGHSTVQLVQSLDLSQQVAAVMNGTPVTFGQLGVAARTEFARATLRGSSAAVGYNLGVHGTLGPWSLGARYLSSLDFRYGGSEVRFTPVSTGLIFAANNPVAPTPVSVDALLASQFTSSGKLAPQTGSSRIEHPWQAQGGIAYTGFAGTTLAADVALIGWSTFNTLPIQFDGNARASSRVLLEEYRDSWSYRFGAEHTMQGGPLRGWTGRAGFAYAQTPAPAATVTPLLPDMDRRNFTLGVGVPATYGHVDFSYLHVNTPGRRGRIVERPVAAFTAAQLNGGAYDLSANVFSVTYSASF